MPTLVGYAPGSGAPIWRLSILEFRWRYTLAEQVAIDAATMDHETPTVRATLRVLEKSMAESSNGIDVADPRTIAGVQYHASLGLIAEARVAVILAAIV